MTPNGHMSISDWLRCLIWTPGRDDVAVTSALLFMSRTVTTMRDGILLYRIARDLGAGRAGSVLVVIIISGG